MNEKPKETRNILVPNRKQSSNLSLYNFADEESSDMMDGFNNDFVDSTTSEDDISMMVVYKECDESFKVKINKIYNKLSKENSKEAKDRSLIKHFMKNNYELQYNVVNEIMTKYKKYYNY